MLVLTRKLMEKLYIGDSICVTVVRLEGGQVRLGIDAPRDIRVVRAELTDEHRGRDRDRDREPAGVAGGRAPLTARGIGNRRHVPSRSGPPRPPSSYEGS